MRTTLDNLQTLFAEGKPFQWKIYAGLDRGLSFEVWQDIGAWLERFQHN